MDIGLYTRTPSEALIKNAQRIADGLTQSITPFPKEIKGRGIVTCGGGYMYFTNAWVLIRMLRYLGCELPIQLWHLGSDEMSQKMKRIIEPFGVECVDGLPIIQRSSRLKNGLINAGWVLKSVAIARCPFAEVMFIDADNLPVRDPSFLFNTQPYRTTGAIFWPDSSVFAHRCVWRVFRVPQRDEPEFESGQLLVDKRINWEAISLAEMLNSRADVFYRMMWGDKDIFRFAWHKLGRTFAIPKFPPQALQAPGSCADILCQHNFDGSRLFQHRIFHKWNLFGENPWIPGFFFENECRTFLAELRSVWDGRCDVDGCGFPRSVRALIDQSLLKTVWLLQNPEVPRKKLSTAACCQSVDNSETWIELKFDRNKTLKTHVAKVGVFWDIAKSAAGVQLILSDEKGPKVKLDKTDIGWRGRWFGRSRNRCARMLSVEDVYPHLRNSVTATTAEVAEEICDHFGDEAHITQPAAGIGDHIVGAYACSGLARLGVRTVFHTRNSAWLARITEPGLIITSQMSERKNYILEYDYANQLRYATSRAQWYAGGLHPLLKPVKPQVNRQKTTERLPFERYILLAPIAYRPSREWPEIHWTRLAHLLREAGYEVVAIGGANDEEHLRTIFDTTQAYWATNHSPAWVVDAMLGASAYVGIDSGMTHLAALLEVNAVAIHSQLQPEFLWPESRVRSITPKARCVFCRWQHERGCLSSCERSCSALATVAPETVLDAVIDFANEKANHMESNGDEKQKL